LANERRDRAKRRQHHDGTPTMIVIAPMVANRRWRRCRRSRRRCCLLYSLFSCGRIIHFQRNEQRCPHPGQGQLW
jgi:hypothetical protein